MILIQQNIRGFAALTEGSDEYNAEVESMYTKITAEDTAKSYADKYNTAKNKLDALANR